MDISAYEKNLDRVSDWIKSVDQKVSIFLAFQAVLLTGIFSFLLNFLSECNSLCLCQFILIFIGIIGLVIGIYKSLAAITPKLGNNLKKSLFYFQDVASMPINEYRTGIKALSKEDHTDLLIEQTYVLATIATRKHHQFRDAVLFFCGGLILIVIGVVYTFILYGF